MDTLGERIKRAREQKELTQEELARLINTKNRSTLSSWEINRREPDYDILNLIANTLEVSVEWLLTGKNGVGQIAESLGIYAIGPTVKIPVLGVIRAGEPIFADQNIICYEDVPAAEVKDGEYFYLVVAGDSMIGSRIQQGDKVLIRKQEYVDNGQIAVVLVNDEEATLKRVKYIDDSIILYPDNPKYQPQIYKAEDVKILGRVVEVKFKP